MSPRKSFLTKQTQASVVIAAAVALSLAGCSSEDADGTEGAPQESAAPTTPAPVESTAPEPTEDVEDTTDASAIEAYVAREAETIPAIMEQSAGMFSDVAITVAGPDAVEFAYTYAEPIEGANAGEQFDNMADTLRTATEAQVFPMMEQAGVPGPQKATYTYLNPDGTELWSQEFVAP